MRQTQALRLTLAALCCLALPGCFFGRSHVNQPIDPARLATIVPHETSAQQVVEVLGAPTEVVQLGNRSAYRYDHRTEKQTALFLLIVGLRGVDTNSDRVWVFLDEAGTVTHVGATLEASQAEYSLPPF